MTGFVGGGVLTNLEEIYLHRNELAGDLIITEDNFSSSIESLYLSGNKLTSINAEPDAILKLRSLYIQDNDGIIIKDELCNRLPELYISNYNDSCRASLSLYRNSIIFISDL